MQENKGLVLVVEDEQNIADLQRRYLSREGFGVHVEADGDAALAAVRRMRPVAIVLDIALHGMDGMEVCRRLREEGDWTPVLFVTARDEVTDRILGLELGADDYLTKPFSPQELVARVKSLLRRAAGPQRDPVSRVGRLTLDTGRRTLLVDDRPVELTTTEFNLLAFLMSHPEQVFSREQLLGQVWGYAGYRDTRVMDVYVSQLRAKLGNASPIRTVRGVGYSVTGAGR
ncbi:response regulator transcription factor [Streptomyces luteolifulvus]|jgi:DNA-binding response OmpR family regulator|uniref:Response regulator transcription factor n=1 Tax=Streptomyces luteolifulvus TaxID=2615112 RepID=A0A6H9UWA4_9ACTN|nr:response regulator transcription factor [Streptomyces luteolifulvus]KAB1144687.1 response regulator transcription factor [Streptomyces luteolifulvus]